MFLGPENRVVPQPCPIVFRLLAGILPGTCEFSVCHACHPLAPTGMSISCPQRLPGEPSKHTGGTRHAWPRVQGWFRPESPRGPCWRLALEQQFAAWVDRGFEG